MRKMLPRKINRILESGCRSCYYDRRQTISCSDNTDRKASTAGKQASDSNRREGTHRQAVDARRDAAVKALPFPRRLCFTHTEKLVDRKDGAERHTISCCRKESRSADSTTRRGGEEDAEDERRKKSFGCCSSCNTPHPFRHASCIDRLFRLLTQDSRENSSSTSGSSTPATPSPVFASLEAKKGEKQERPASFPVSPE